MLLLVWRFACFVLCLAQRKVAQKSSSHCQRWEIMVECLWPPAANWTMPCPHSRRKVRGGAVTLVTLNLTNQRAALMMKLWKLRTEIWLDGVGSSPCIHCLYLHYYLYWTVSPPCNWYNQPCCHAVRETAGSLGGG